MFRKYEKTFRINRPGKLCLSPAEITRLFNGEVVVEEKLDGANVGIIRHKKGFHLQKRGSLVGPSEHAQFQYFHAWANRIKYDSIMKIPIRHIVYGELMYAVHTVFYDKLPDYFLMFDVWNDIKQRYLNRDEREEFTAKYGLEFFHVPLISRGYYDFEDVSRMLPEKSAFGDRAEGIVVKRYTKGRQYHKAKIVWEQFHKDLEESDHWMHREVRVNKLAKG